MRVVFFGTPAFAAPTLAALVASRHDVVGVVTQPDRARGRGQAVTFAPVKALAMAHGIPVVQPNTLKDVAAIDAIRAFAADIGVVAAYGKILPQAVLDVPSRGLINVHASLLPRWRGAAPIHRAIQAGDTVTGVTIMRVVLALDAGAMLSRIEVPIDPEVTSDALEAVLANAGARLLVDTLDRMERGAVAEVPQDEALVTYAAKLQRADGELDWSRPATALHNQIRGLHPWPMASAFFRGKRVIIRGSRVSAQSLADATSSAMPGAIVGLSDEGIGVATGDGVLDIVELQPESRAPMRARDFTNGMRPRVGEMFTRVASA